MNLQGFASEKSTKMVSEIYKELDYNLLGKTGLRVTEVGFGGYRIDVKSSSNKNALKQALLSGINLVDTSSTYNDGNSELLVGDVLRELVQSNKLLRQSTVIVTKGGYLQGQNYTLSQNKKIQNKRFKDLVEYQQGLEHCIHPEFLEDQITKSINRLGIETIDIYLLHNPEYYLKWAKINNLNLYTARKEYYTRIKKAFEHLEKEVVKGRIKNYGISSNTFPLSPDDFEFTSLERVIEISKEISEHNNFGIIEFPMNFAETDAFTKPNQSDNMTLLQLAKNENIGVLINRPLNVMFNNQLIPMTEPPISKSIDPKLINDNFKNILVKEKVISKELKQSEDKEFSYKIENNLFVFEELGDSWLEFKGYAQWQSALNRYFLPRLDYCKGLIEQSLLKNKILKKELSAYIDKTNNLLTDITSYFNNEQLKLANTIKNNLIDIAPELASAKNLSNMAIRALRLTNGVNTVLVGMIRPQYVNDVIEELSVHFKKDFEWEKINFKTLY